MSDVVAWIEGLVDDCTCRAPFGVGWDLDRSEAPITATVTPADRPSARIVLGQDDLLGRISFAARLQAFLDLEFDRPVPTCPVHEAGLAPNRVGNAVHWRCDAGDFECPVGEYQDALWPPGPGEEASRIAPMLARRFRRRQLGGIHGFGVELRDGRWRARIELRPDADEDAIRDAADPIRIEVEHVDAIHTVRVHRAATDAEPAHQALTRTGVMIQLASLRGRLRRGRAGEHPYEFLVDDTPVRLLPEHQLGPSGCPLVLDRAGVPFADEGDTVCCVGGFAPTGPVRGRTPVFNAGEIRVYEPQSR